MSDHEKMGRQMRRGKRGLESKLPPGELEDAVEKSTPLKARLERAKRPAIKAEHTVQSGDTLSGLAQKYYGTAVREKWMAIYEANKEIIGDNPSLIRVGQVLQIPDLDS